jgi:hypothetical protein
VWHLGREGIIDQEIKSGQLAHSLGQAVARGALCLGSVPGLLKIVIREKRWQRFRCESTGRVAQEEHDKVWAVAQEWSAWEYRVFPGPNEA